MSSTRIVSSLIDIKGEIHNIHGGLGRVTAAQTSHERGRFRNICWRFSLCLCIRIPENDNKTNVNICKHTSSEAAATRPFFACNGVTFILIVTSPVLGGNRKCSHPHTGDATAEKSLKKNREKFNVLNFSRQNTSLSRRLCENGYRSDLLRALGTGHFRKIATPSQTRNRSCSHGFTLAACARAHFPARARNLWRHNNALLWRCMCKQSVVENKLSLRAANS